MLVDQVTHVADVLFKHSIGGWVCKHDCCQVLLVFIYLWDRKGQRETKEEMFLSWSQTLAFYFKGFRKMESWSFHFGKYDDNNI